MCSGGSSSYSVAGIIALAILAGCYSARAVIDPDPEFSSNDTVDTAVYAYKCWAKNRSFSDMSCNCLNQPRPAAFDDHYNRNLNVTILSPDKGW